MKKALITGSSRGIGAETARELSRRGFSVCLNYLNSEKEAKILSEELGCPAVQADVSDPEQVRALFEAAGPFDLLVNNAGVAWGGLLSEMTDTEWRRLFAVNVDGVFNCCRAAIPYMVRQKSGCIVNLSSILGVAGGSCEAAYSATKGAVISLTRSLAKELGPSGIRVNCVAPGAIDTHMLKNLTDTEKETLAEATALCRLGTAGDIARVVAFLASDDAGFITGQVIGADGALVI